MVDFRVKTDVKVDNKVVIAAGAIAKGQVVRGQKAKGLGKEGDDQQTLAIVLGVFVCILFLFLKGKNATVPSGFQLNSSVASTVTINA